MTTVSQRALLLLYGLLLILSRTTNAEPWSLEVYCQAQKADDIEAIESSSSRDLLLRLGLDTVHPFCKDGFKNIDDGDIPSQGPLLVHDHLETWYDVLVTVISMATPSILAMSELWLRLFAALLAPLGICQLLVWNFRNRKEDLQHGEKSSNHNHFRMSMTCLVTVASGVVLLTDTLYVLSYGALYGGRLLLLAVILALKTSHQYRLGRHTVTVVLALAVLALYLGYDPVDNDATVSPWAFGGRTELSVPDEGLYYDETNPLVRGLVQAWPSQYYTYDSSTGSSPWMPTGDSRTGLPFLLNRVPVYPDYTRVWCPLESDGEVVALDWAFPESGHDPTRPVYFLLHGLNGSSQEEFIRDFVWRNTKRGSTVVIMIARGLSDLPVLGWNLFHGARWTDAHEASKAVKVALHEGTILVGVGYSMGAIILSNLVARAGSDIHLDGAVSISGGLDMREQTYFYRAQRLWQPMLTQTLRDEFLVGKWGERVRARLPKDVMKRFMRATHVSAVDETAVVYYNGFDDLDHYYREMSALGDVPPGEYTNQTRLADFRRIHQVAVPFCVVHALDDPLITFRTVAASHGLMHPTNLTQNTGSGNLLLLLTKGGGHVGWPLGVMPQKSTWEWMNDAASSFGEALLTSTRQHQNEIDDNNID